MCLAILFSATLFGQDVGLLFQLSGEHGLKADHAAGDAVPNYLYNVAVIPDGAYGQGIRCGHTQLLSYWASGNIYAQRGTLSFFWRATPPVDETPLTLFRVSYADHSSWDMQWLRIDWNGHGFDAFVTDVNLARIRTSCTAPTPSPAKWTHLALAWDETEGIRFYVDGILAGKRDTVVVLDAALDQLGPHSRIISPYQVQSQYNYLRGGDIDEVLIYNHALTGDNIRMLSQGEEVRSSAPARNLNQDKWRDEWKLRYGWNRDGDLPPRLENKTTTIRKVQILETYDVKRWWWKANDGIRETTWPGVFNRSRIIGRTDYYILPDWDCYTVSGKEVRFNMPDEKWNYLEISGGADGTIAVTPDPQGKNGTKIFTREKRNERTFHKLERPVTGQTIVFANNVQETPIGEFDAFLIREGDAPEGVARLTYTLSARGNHNNPNIKAVREYINGRHPADEISVMLATPGYSGGRQLTRRQTEVRTSTPPTNNKLPLVHIIIPSDFRSGALGNTLTGNSDNFTYTWHNMDGGLDGIRITLPAMNVQPLENGLFPINVKVKDPIWTLRNMMDVSFSVKPNEERTVWLDLRDRILPDNKPLYLTITSAGADFNTNVLEGATIELIFKKKKEAVAEHTADRFAQVRDNHAMIVEEHPNNRRLSKYVQIENDMTDLLHADPEHERGREYWYIYNTEQPRPEMRQNDLQSSDAPLWAHLQLKYLKEFRHFVEWQIDNRQIENGEFGGGLSDDSDFGNFLPPLALMGVIPDKLERSLSLMMEAVIREGMMTNGTSTIQTDGLHTFEEGANVIGELNLLRMGDPKEVERLMEVAYALKHHITGVNPAGHRHFRSDFFSATKTAKGEWAWSFPWAGLHTIPAIQMAEFYGNAEARQLVIDIADGYLAHATVTPDGNVNVHSQISFYGDTIRTSGQDSTFPILWAAWKWTGNQKYLKPILDRGEAGLRAITSNALDLADLRQTLGKEIIANVTPENGSDFARHMAWQITGDKTCLEKYYAEQIISARLRNYINTEGSIWTDRLSFSSDMLQRSRMGGTANSRNQIYPGNTVSWRFKDGETAEQVAILLPFATQKEFEVEFFNTASTPVEAYMKGADVIGGQWQLSYGTDTNGDGRLDKTTSTRKVTFGRNETVMLTIPPQQHIMVKMKLSGKGEWLNRRPDLAIGAEDVRINGNRVTVTVHSLGNAAAPATEIALTDPAGKIVSRSVIPAIAGVINMKPKRAEVSLALPPDANVHNLFVLIDPQNKLKEILKTNNRQAIQ
jgi:hypothetical protein